ncbi:hypothetical protein CPB84DRAFT_1849690 [Gymnopilus junonius]|uniref:Uncharacterized protein n=1 Tax=Gymnopilus junonius TaxID=109634 RepID=A0A9P5TL54_GYMJU|nr:hypothetical protein CPB84DRAFT_1849690 [Gymnopilus junonius]
MNIESFPLTRSTHNLLSSSTTSSFPHRSAPTPVLRMNDAGVIVVFIVTFILHPPSSIFYSSSLTLHTTPKGSKVRHNDTTTNGQRHDTAPAPPLNVELPRGLGAYAKDAGVKR